MQGEITEVIVIGYEGDVYDGVHEWKRHAMEKSVIGMDKEGRIVISIPNHLAILKYKYVKPT